MEAREPLAGSPPLTAERERPALTDAPAPGVCTGTSARSVRSILGGD